MSNRIRDILGTSKKLKDIGVEIEIEGNTGFQIEENFKNWRVCRDGSLRGDGAREFVFIEPLNLSESIEQINALYEGIKKNKGTINDSTRAGTHIHFNVLDYTVDELVVFITAYFIFEEFLLQLCGEERAGNLFCLGLRDSAYIGEVIRDIYLTKNLKAINSNDMLKYGSINLYAVRNYGSLEFRSFRTATTPEPVVRWLQILSCLKKNSKQFKTPVEMLELISAGGYMQLATALFEDYTPFVITPSAAAEQTVYTAVRETQLWAFGQ